MPISPRNIIILCTAQILIYFFQSFSSLALSSSFALSLSVCDTNSNLLFKVWLQIVGYSSKCITKHRIRKIATQTRNRKKMKQVNESERFSRYTMILYTQTYTYTSLYAYNVWPISCNGMVKFKITMLAWFVEVFVHRHRCRIRLCVRSTSINFHHINRNLNKNCARFSIHKWMKKQIQAHKHAHIKLELIN